MHDRWRWHMRISIHDLHCSKLSLLLLFEVSVNHAGIAQTKRIQIVNRWFGRCAIRYHASGTDAYSDGAD